LHAVTYESDARGALTGVRVIDVSRLVLIENFVPGKLERLGFAPSALLAINPKLVILRISGWGQTGPFRGKPGFGTTVEAMSGFAAMNGFPDRPPTLPPMALADMVTGLLRRERCPDRAAALRKERAGASDRSGPVRFHVVGARARGRQLRPHKVQAEVFVELPDSFWRVDQPTSTPERR
jgi:hypothetical protein